jgi:hypothetical protein
MRSCRLWLMAAAHASVADALAAWPGLDASDDVWLRGACLVVRRLTVGRLPRLALEEEGATANLMDAVFAKLKAEDLNEE